jgi:hypothetical protein
MSWWLILLLVYTHGFMFHFGAGLMLVVIAHTAKVVNDELMRLGEAVLFKSVFWPAYFVMSFFK